MPETALDVIKRYFLAGGGLGEVLRVLYTHQPETPTQPAQTKITATLAFGIFQCHIETFASRVTTDLGEIAELLVGCSHHAAGAQAANQPR